MSPAAAILELALQHPAWLDRHLTREERAVALAPWAAAVAAETRSLREQAIVLSVAEHETAFSTAVIRGGDCSALPRGQRCDNGRARGFGQLHRAACPAAYAFSAGTDESIRAEVHCVLGLLRGHEARCGSLVGAFAMFATGHSCSWGGAWSRVLTVRRFVGELARAEGG